MARNVLLLVAGALVGGVAAYVVVGGNPAGGVSANDVTPAPVPGQVPQSAGNRATATGDGETEAADAGVSDAGFVGVRVAAYERALEATDAIDIESTIELALAAPQARARDLEITALLARLTEIDPRRAVEFAQSAFLDTPFLIQTFAALARVDADAAADELASVTPAAKQRRVALALLDVLGHERGVDVIGAALPDETRASFDLDVLVARAEADPAGAMAEVLELESTVLRSYVLPRLAEAAVRHDPRTALALGDSITDFNSRYAYLTAVLNAWAELDPDAVFAFLETGDPNALAVSSGGAFATLARYDADRLLAAVGRLPLAARATARRAVMQSLAERDPEAALDFLDRIAPGRDREQMLATIAQTYGRQDPELALAWARSLSPPSQRALQGVLQGIAEVDPNRAVDLLIEQLDSQPPAQAGLPSFAGTSPFMAMQMLSASPDVDLGRLADALLARSDPLSRSLVSVAVATWAARDSDAALSWALANGDRLDPMVLRGVAERMAAENLDLALGMLDRIAPPQRPGWIGGLVSQMAQTDIVRAQGFLSQLRGQDGYDEAYGVVVQTMARTDPAGAARMLGEAPSLTDTLRSASFMIAREWANRDPRAAARWAQTLESSDLRRTAVTNVTSAWALRDAAEAERWLFGLASGPTRDAAADGYVDAAAQAGRFEPRVLEAYSSERLRQESASRAIAVIGTTDLARAEQLLDRHVTDPDIRARTEQQLARISGMSGTP